VLASGETLTGGYGVSNIGSGLFFDVQNFRVPLPADIAPGNTTFISAGSSYTTNCPGPGLAAAGHFCVYETAHVGVSAVLIERPDIGVTGVWKNGVMIVVEPSGTGACVSYGTWAVTAP
jgi:hypothetical protein